jgi:spoIIIJ-associated protein
MEWVETTGNTLEEAKEAALDQLGVAEDDAEFEVVDEKTAHHVSHARRWKWTQQSLVKQQPNS